MIGRITAWTRRVFKPLPAPVSSITELVEVCMSPSKAMWDYVSLDGPWRIIRVHRTDDLVFFLETYDELRPAIEAFYLYNRPQIDQQCMMIDGHDVCVVGWDHTADFEDDYGWRWFGCAFSFMLLAHFDPVEAALWEQIAGNAEGDFS